MWVSCHKETGFELAIKVVPVTDVGRSSIEKEIEVLKKCKSPNVLSYYGACSKPNEVWVRKIDGCTCSVCCVVLIHFGSIKILMDYCAVGSVKDMIMLTVEPLEEIHAQQICLGMLKGK